MNSSPLVLVVQDAVLADALEAVVRQLRDAGVRVARGSAASPSPRALEDAARPEDLAACEIVVSSPRHRITARTLERAPALRAIVLPTIGIDSVDLHAAAQRGIALAHGPVPENYESLAEATVMLMLNLLRRVPAGEPRALAGRTVGLIGWGRVAHAVARRLQDWGVRLLAHVPRAASRQAASDEVEFVELAQLLRESDLVSVHATLNASSAHMLGARELALMKRGAYLLNTARGGVVDERALAAALREGRIAGAALDVFEVEPLPVDSELRQLPNVILTPHRVGHTQELQRALLRTACDTVAALLAHRPPPYPCALPT